MNKRQAKAYALRVLAVEARHHLDNGSDWLLRPLRPDGIATDADGEFTDADRLRVETAVAEIADDLERRANRLGGGT